ncbi:hypothetical protein Tco_0532318 [Tanacetum coccineum]
MGSDDCSRMRELDVEAQGGMACHNKELVGFTLVENRNSKEISTKRCRFCEDSCRLTLERQGCVGMIAGVLQSMRLVRMDTCCGKRCIVCMIKTGGSLGLCMED